MTPCSVSNTRRRGRPLALAAIALTASLVAACGPSSRPEAIEAAKSPEQVVFARSQDDVVSGGLLFSPPHDAAKPLAIIWIHGWGVNFYEPSYVAIGRALAQQSYTVVDGNTRMHDLGKAPCANKGTNSGRRCIPPRGVARRSNTLGILPPRALRGRAPRHPELAPLFAHGA